MRPDASKNGQISPLGHRSGCQDCGSRPRRQEALSERGKSANIHPGLEFIWSIPAYLLGFFRFRAIEPGHAEVFAMRIFHRAVIVCAGCLIVALAGAPLASAQSSIGGKKNGTSSTSSGKAKQITDTGAHGGSLQDPSLYAAGAIKPKTGGAAPIGAPCRTNCGQ